SLTYLTALKSYAIVDCTSGLNKEKHNQSLVRQIVMSEDTKSKDFYDYLIEIIKQAVNTYLTAEQLQIDIAQLPIDLRFSAQSSFGDYSMPVMAWEIGRASCRERV